MKRSIISARLCAAVLGLSLVWCHQTFAVPVITVTETTPGQLTLFNGSSIWFIYGFEIERPASASNPTTTQLGWSAYTCTLSCNVGAFGGFGYILDGGNPFVAGIAPGASSSSFSFRGVSGNSFPDGTSNTISLPESLIFVFAAALVSPISDGTSNTILLPEIVRFGFPGSIHPEITDGTSNTIFFGEGLPVPAPPRRWPARPDARRARPAWPAWLAATTQGYILRRNRAALRRR
jgi:hypothetical protein